MKPCITFNLNNKTRGFLTVGNDPITVTFKGKTYHFELLNSGGAEPVTKSGSHFSQNPPKSAWIALQCKVAKSVRFEVSRGMRRRHPVVLKSIFANNLEMAKAIARTEAECDEMLSKVIAVLEENNIEVIK